MYGGHGLEPPRGLGQGALGGLGGGHRAPKGRRPRRRGLTPLPASRTSSGESSPCEHRLGRPGQPHLEVVVDLDGQLAAVEPDRRSGSSRRASTAATAAPLAPVPGGERLPHPALEDPRAHRRAVDADERHVGAVREQLVSLDLGADRAPGRAPRPPRPPRSRTAGCRSRRAGSATRARRRSAFPLPSGPRRESRRRSATPCPSPALAVVGDDDRRPDLAGLGEDRELVRRPSSPARRR